VRSDDGGDMWSYACGSPNVSAGTTHMASSVYTLPDNASAVWAVFGGAADVAVRSGGGGRLGGGVRWAPSYELPHLCPPPRAQTGASTSPGTGAGPGAPLTR